MDDVIVVGAGPAGNNTALKLASAGHAVTVIDWRHHIGDKLCTGIVGRECLQHFPINPEFIYREASSAQVVTPSQTTVRFETAAPQACIVDRVAYVASFAERAQAAGARYLLGQRVMEVETGPEGVTVITDAGQQRARALVVAAGFGSKLTHRLGLGAVGDFVTGVQAVVATRDVDEVAVYLGQNVAPGFFAWLTPTSPNAALLGLLSRRKSSTYLSNLISQLESEGTITGVLTAPSQWAIPLRPLKRTYSDRLLVVGDAAGQVKPTTGGGIYYSLLSSQIAASVLGDALGNDDLSADRLSQYQREWKALLSDELEAGYSARRLFEFLSDQQINSLVQQVSNNGIKSELINSSEMSFDWHSPMIAKVMGHPVLSRSLRVINPILARIAPRERHQQMD